MSQQVMIKPHQVDSLPMLDAAQKQSYKNGLANLWAQYDGSAEGSQAKQDARQRLVTASQKIMQQISQRNRPGAGNAGQQRPPQNAPQGGQPQAQGQNAQPAQPQQAQAQQTQGQQSQTQVDVDAALKQKISNEVNQMQVYPTPETTTQQQFDQYKQNFKTQLGTLKYKAEKAKENIQNIQRHINMVQAQNGEIPPDMQQKLPQLHQLHETCMRNAKTLMDQNTQNYKLVQARKNANQANHSGQGNGDGSGPPRPPTQQGLQQTNQEVSASPAQPQAPNAPNLQQRPQQTMAQAAATQGRPGTAGPQQAPIRPPVNAVAAQQYGSQQYPGQPNSAIPQSANPAQQRPHALSQQGAIAKAQEQNYAQQTVAANPQQQQQIQQPQPGSNGFNQVPQQGTPTSATPNQSQGPISHKLPIPKTLTLGAQTQTPVPGPPARPTMGHGGMLSVPGVQKAPPFTLEGEGDHVLSKRKLDELVRQVTGSTDPADGLTPEVEEAVLSLTDDFVDNVITKACQMAKLRQGQTLELRDIQLILERNYGIRVPGYSLDEARVARKFQPGAGWIAKVQAVQAGKVMGGNRDA